MEWSVWWPKIYPWWPPLASHWHLVVDITVPTACQVLSLCAATGKNKALLIHSITHTYVHLAAKQKGLFAFWKLKDSLSIVDVLLVSVTIRINEGLGHDIERIKTTKKITGNSSSGIWNIILFNKMYIELVP